MKNLQGMVAAAQQLKLDRRILQYANTAAIHTLIDLGIDPRVAVSRVRDAIGSDNIPPGLRDTVDVYVVVNCIDGRQYTLDRLYQLNPDMGRVDTAGAVEVKLCLKPLNAPAWAAELDDFHFATYWMY